MPYGLRNMLFFLALTQMHALNAYEREAQYQKSLSDVSKMLCRNKIMTSLNMTKNDLIIYAILADTTSKDENSWLEPCYSQAKILWQECMPNKSNPETCYQILFDKIKIVPKDYQQKVTKADQLNHQMAQNYKSCLPIHLDQKAPSEQRKIEQQCQEKMVSVAIPYIEKLKASQMCKTSFDCLKLLNDLISKIH